MTLDLGAIEDDLQRQLERARRMPTGPMISIRADTLRGLIAAARAEKEAKVRGLRIAVKLVHNIGMVYVRQKLSPGLSKAGRSRAHAASCCAAEIADAIARIAELREKASQLEKRCVLTMKEQE